MENSGIRFKIDMENEVVTPHGTFKEKELFEIFEKLPLSVQEVLKKRQLEAMQKKYPDIPVEKLALGGKTFFEEVKKSVQEQCESRPMVPCVQCGKTFPYGSKDGKCDACQITERLSPLYIEEKQLADDLLELDEEQMRFASKILEIKQIINKEEAEGEKCNGEWLLYFSTEKVPEKHCNRLFFTNMVKGFCTSTSRMRDLLCDITKNGIKVPMDATGWIDRNENLIVYMISEYVLFDVPIPFIDKRMCQTISYKQHKEIEKKQEELEAEAEAEADKKAKAEAKKAEQEAKKAVAKEKAKSAFNPPEYPPAHKIKCKGSAQMVSNAPAQRAWLEKWAKDAWNGKDLWSAKTAKQYVADKKNGVGTIFATAVVVEAVIFDGVEAEPIED
jgi:septum formation inhibitor MinC